MVRSRLGRLVLVTLLGVLLLLAQTVAPPLAGLARTLARTPPAPTPSHSAATPVGPGSAAKTPPPARPQPPALQLSWA